MDVMLSPEVMGTVGGVVAALSGVAYAVLRRPLIASLRQRLEESEAERDRIVSTMRQEILELQRELHCLRVRLVEYEERDSD